MGYLEHWRRRIEYWCARKMIDIATRLYVRAGMTLVDYTDTFANASLTLNGVYAPIPLAWRDETYDFIRRELSMLCHHAREFAFCQRDAQQEARERLARRYDPGAALNRAFEDAAVKIAATNSTSAALQQQELARNYGVSVAEALSTPAGMGPLELTDKQKAALKVQEDTLRRNMQARARL